MLSGEHIFTICENASTKEDDVGPALLEGFADKYKKPSQLEIWRKLENYFG